MKRREIAFLLIGLGIGLIASAVVAAEFVWWFHHMFIVGIQWVPASVVLFLPFLFVLIGALLLYRGKSDRHPN